MRANVAIFQIECARRYGESCILTIVPPPSVQLLQISNFRIVNCEEVSGETRQTTSRTAFRSPELRRTAPDHLARFVDFS